MLQLKHVCASLIGSTAMLPVEVAGRPVTGVTVDSRAVQPGGLFVALHGERTDGHLYLADAFARGALAAIAEQRRIADCGLQIANYLVIDCSSGHVQIPKSKIQNPNCIFLVPSTLTALQQLSGYWRSQLPAVVVVGITGSVGKTTTKETVANVLTQHYVTLRSEGNLNNEIGLPLTLLQLTPEHERAVLEMGMYALGEITRLSDLARPRIGIVTNVGPTHLERMGSIERIAQAKAELVQALPSAGDGGVAILNADDPLVRAMAGLTRARVFTYGLNEAADLWADDISSEGLEGIRLRLHYGVETFHLHLPMLGRHSVHTALRGAAVGLIEGLSWTEIIAGLLEVRGQLRLMVVPGLRETTLIDDTYNASPISMMAALHLLEDIANRGQRCVAVLGDMFELGSYEEEGHRVVGGRAAQVVDKLVTVGPRARWIAEEALADGMASADVYPAESNTDAIGVLQGLIRPGDIILIKGSRGMAMETIVDVLSRPRE
ncbi:MAG: UDP-N-acetylmuramoyl-tripeptide--D-alanyl-D-alanine ligase [Chloroflexi bacterium]|nr:UDP-N-acetylmuramoyl-tripeptide--D-alanyl-D-alanine ligase [Chloroflexota bacterium]